jgi:putative oxidoreductase
MKRFLLTSSPLSNELGLLIIRLGIGSLFVGYGYLKLVGGVALWQTLGMAMGYVGIYIMPTFWGFCAMLAELLGGLCLIIGLCTRFAAIALSMVMIVAFIMLSATGQSLNATGFPLSLLVVMIGLLVAGAGRFSIDHFLLQRFE